MIEHIRKRWRGNKQEVLNELSFSLSNNSFSFIHFFFCFSIFSLIPRPSRLLILYPCTKSNYLGNFLLVFFIFIETLMFVWGDINFLSVENINLGSLLLIILIDNSKQKLIQSFKIISYKIVNLNLTVHEDFINKYVSSNFVIIIQLKYMSLWLMSAHLITHFL